MKSIFTRFGAAVAVTLLLAMIAACTDMLYSDAQNEGRKSAKEREAALRSMKLSSTQADVAEQIKGHALVQLLSGNTHVKAYRKRSDDIKPYITYYDYFGPDGTFINRDTRSRRTIDYQVIGSWKVDADTLCITQQSEQNCYTIRLAPDGAIQYWIRKPGDPFDGLFTLNVKIVRKGLQDPEYISDPAAFR